MNFEKCLIDTTIWVLYFKGEKELEDRTKGGCSFLPEIFRISLILARRIVKRLKRW